MSDLRRGPSRPRRGGFLSFEPGRKSKNPRLPGAEIISVYGPIGRTVSHTGWRPGEPASMSSTAKLRWQWPAGMATAEMAAALHGTSVRCNASVLRRLPNHLDVVDHLNDASHPGNRFLGKLLEVEARHLASEEKPTTIMLAPDSLKGQMRLTANSLFC